MAIFGEAQTIEGITDWEEDAIEVVVYRNNADVWLRITMPMFVAPETLGIDPELCEMMYDLNDDEIMAIIRSALKENMRLVATVLGDWRAEELGTDGPTRR